MQADVILKEPPPWVPPLSLSGGVRVEGGGGARPPSYAPGECVTPVLVRKTEVKHTCPQHTGLVSRLVFTGLIPVLHTNLWFEKHLKPTSG